MIEIGKAMSAARYTVEYTEMTMRALLKYLSCSALCATGCISRLRLIILMIKRIVMMALSTMVRTKEEIMV